MATVPSPRTWAVGELLTAAKLNTDLRDGLNFLLAPPLAILTGASGTIADFTATAVGWPSETIDRDNGHSTSSNTSRYTVQTAGYYAIEASLGWGVGNIDTLKSTQLRKNGSTQLRENWDTHKYGGGGAYYPVLFVSVKTQLAVGDYVEVLAFHNNGSNLNLQTVGANPRFELLWIST